ncbi:hypothetical protein L218DRAFT_238612 [Marasmius fiardii PR-910]|nr:hypothetical protein L218DRAFT_238612 [Marasmius fiardii PR-910]
MIFIQRGWSQPLQILTACKLVDGPFIGVQLFDEIGNLHKAVEGVEIGIGQSVRNTFAIQCARQIPENIGSLPDAQKFPRSHLLGNTVRISDFSHPS